MKIIPLILVFIVIISELHLCKGEFACQDTIPPQVDMCNASEDGHSCCSLPTEEDHAPGQEGSCTEGCPYSCCAQVIPPAINVYPLFPSLEIDRRMNGKISRYDHEFTHMIWHPPQVG